MFTVLWTRAPMIVALVVVAVVAAYGIASLKTDQYQATAKVRVVDPNSEAVFDGVQIRTDPKRDVDTQLALMRSDDLRADVDQSLGEEASQITSVSMSGVGSTDLIGITVASPSPQVAADAANAFADIYVKNRKEQVSSAFTGRADELRQKSAEIDQQIQDIDTQLAEGVPDNEKGVLQAKRAALVSQQTDLQTRATQFDVEAATRSGNVEVAEKAQVPTTPFSPTPLRDAALAGILALLVGIGLAFLLDRLDDKIHNPDDVDAVADGLPVVGVVPIYSLDKKGARKLSRKTPRTVVPLASSTAESYRALRSNLRFSAVGVKRTSVLLTSAEGAEGKSTVAANLAVVLAESGLRVVLVSADLRKPTISSFFGMPETDKGLTNVLLGDLTLADAMVRVPLQSGRNLYLLPSGPLPQNPAEVLGSQAMRDLLESIERAGADFILIDSPPVLPVADALALSQFTDGVLVLSVAGRTPKGHLAETLERLRQVNAQLVGVVLNGVPTKGRYSRYYGGYTYGYRNSYISDKASHEVTPAARPGVKAADVDLTVFAEPAPTPAKRNGNGTNGTNGRGKPKAAAEETRAER